MPKPSLHALIWSEVQQHYELHIHGHPEQCFSRGDEPAFSHWLGEHTAFAFLGQAGRISVLKEARRGGRGYWYACRTHHRHTRKLYLGSTEKDQALPCGFHDISGSLEPYITTKFHLTG